MSDGVPLHPAENRGYRELYAASRALVRHRPRRADPHAALQPVDDSRAGRAAQRVAVGIGAVGEWVDRRVAHRR